MEYFTSDHHFGHENIIKLCNRPFANHHEMDRHMIDKWNEVVTADDTVYHLGDFGYKASASYLKGIIEQLNGTIIFIRGNHDKKTMKAFNLIDKFIEVYDMLEVTVDGQHIYLCHYPTIEWPGFYRGSWHLFGHVHGNIPQERLHPNQVDVGVDSWNFTPASFFEIANKIKENNT